MVKTTTVAELQAAQRGSDTEIRGPQYKSWNQVHEAIREGLTAESPLGEIVGRVRAITEQEGVSLAEREIRDTAERIQASLRASIVSEPANEADSGQLDTSDDVQPEPASSPLAALAERMVRERSNGSEVGDPFEGMELDVDPSDAFGLVQANVTAWLDERGRWASPIEIRHKTDELMQAAQSARPGPAAAATYTVAPDGTVSDYAPIQLPDMPAPAPVEEPTNGLKVPSDSIFDDGDFAVSMPLANRAKILIARHPDHLKHLEALSVIYLWKRQGGKSKGRATFGKCSKPSGLLKHFSEAQFVIWLAADHCRAAGYRDRELEALLFHEMLHTAVTEADENTGRGGGPALVPHELEVFRAEVEIYGLWAPELKEVGPAFQQLRLMDQAPFQTLVQDMVDQVITEVAQVVLPPDGQLIHDDGTPLTAEEIAAQEAAELRDDPAEFDDEYPRESDLKCSVCGEAMWIESAEQDHEIAQAIAAGMPPVLLCESCGEDSDADLDV